MLDSTTIGALSHGSGLDGNDQLQRHLSRIIIGYERLVGTSVVGTTTLIWGGVVMQSLGS